MNEHEPKVQDGLLLTAPCPGCAGWSRLLIDHLAAMLFECGLCGFKFPKMLLAGACERTRNDLLDTKRGVRRN